MHSRLTIQRVWDTNRPTFVFFLAPRNLSNHMDRQARGVTVLVKSREMTCRSQTLRRLLGRRSGKDDRK
jgi:hypothetical protein